MVAQRSVPIHRIRGNAKVWTPDTVLVFDTETATEKRDQGELLRMRLWCAVSTDRRGPKGKPRPDEWGDGTTAKGLAAWVNRQCVGRKSVWVYGHNIGFDLTATRLPLELMRIGWQIDGFAIHTKSPWFRLSKGSHRIVITDSWSVLPRPLADLGRMVGIHKPSLPAGDADSELWAERCRADVEICLRAVLSAMDWWDANALGQWSITGPASGWHAYRHLSEGSLQVVDPDPEGIAADRSAIYGGRRGTWRTGTLTLGPFHDLDFVAAYPTIAATLPLPNKRVKAFDSLPVSSPLIGGMQYDVQAECLIETDSPDYPVRVDGRTWFPVGRFWTSLCGPELVAARDAGHLLEVGRGWIHRTGLDMQPWARWLLSVQHAPAGDHPEVARVMAKLWGRSVLGRFAAKGSETAELGPAPTDGWAVEECWDVEHHCQAFNVDMGGQRYYVVRAGETDDTYPAVYGWVESHVRVRLTRAIKAAGAGAVANCNTDGFIVIGRTLGTAAGRGAVTLGRGAGDAERTAAYLDAVRGLVSPLTLRIKATHQAVTVLGPQHTETAGKRAFSGLPAIAKRLTAAEIDLLPGARKAAVKRRGGAEGNTYSVLQWPGMAWQLQHGDAAGYVRPQVTPVMNGPYAPGWILTDGTVYPLAMNTSENGTNTILPFVSSHYAIPPRGALAAGQNSALDSIWWQPGDVNQIAPDNASGDIFWQAANDSANAWRISASR